MRKKNKFDKIFLIGLVPFLCLGLLIITIVSGIIYGSFNSRVILPETPRYEQKHICPKKEKIYIHDTIRIKVPVNCNKAHVQEEPAASVNEAPNDTNGTNK